MTIYWSSSDDHIAYPASGSSSFPPFDVWNSGGAGNESNDAPPVLQFSITPLAASFDRSDLQNGTYTFYLYPSAGSQDCNGGGGVCDYTVGTAAGQQAPIIHGGCSQGGYSDASGDKYDCSATIINLPNTSSSYLLHFLDFYDSANVAVTGETSAGGGGAATFIGQATIDVTGQARNVLKRVRIVASPTPSYIPSEAIQAQDICKREQTAPVVPERTTGTEFINTSGGTLPNSTDACNPETYP